MKFKGLRANSWGKLPEVLVTRMRFIRLPDFQPERDIPYGW